MKCSTYSLAEVFQLRSKAFAKISDLAFQIDEVASRIADLDAAVMAAAEKNVDEMQGVVSAARSLAQLIEGGAA